MATQGWPTGESGLDGLIGASSTPEVHTSVWALTSFLSVLGALLGTPFSVTFGLALCLGLLGFVLAVAGVAATSRPYVRVVRSRSNCVSAWSRWRSSGSGTSNLDTAFGDAQLPTLHEVLEWLNARVGAQQTPVPAS